MNNEQEKALIRHMNQNDNDSFEMHAEWASLLFGFTVTPTQCRDLFMASLF